MTPLLPNLEPVPNYFKDATIVTMNGDNYLEFSAATANIGSGPFEIRHSGIFYTSGGIQYEEAIQRIYYLNGKCKCEYNTLM